MTPLEKWLGISSEFLRQTVTENQFIAHRPTPKQALFLAITEIEALYGGAAGGGKTDTLLSAALQFVHVPFYSALILRKTYADLSKPDSLIPRSFAWLGGKATWKTQEHCWQFPSGAVLSFGYLDNESDKYQYQSAAYQCICFDELTQVRETDYRYMFSRLRKPEGMKVPLRMRAASNPGGFGHDWVKRRFITEGKRYGRWFVPAKLSDNPYLNQESYIRSLAQLDPITRRQLLNGDWTARQGGSMFRREWFKFIEVIPSVPSWCRFWDLAATEKKKGNEPDWTTGALVGALDGQWYVKSIVKRRGSPKEIEDLIKSTAQSDGRGVSIRMEREPGASGITVVDHYARDVLTGFDFLGVPSLKNKVSKFSPLSSAAESGNVFLQTASWNGDFLDEAEGFDPTHPDSGHDDQLDAVSGAIGVLTTSLKNPTNAHYEGRDNPERFKAERLGRGDF